jgi:hypothetical protein
MGTHAAPKSKTKRGFAYLAIAGGALAMTIGGVFATGTITVNDGNTIEFGQGLASTSTCDTGLTAALTQAYSTSDSAFYVSTIVISGIQDFACAGKTIHVSLIGSSGAICSVDGTHTSGSNQDAFLIADGGSTGSNDDIEKTVDVAASCDASTVEKVAITTS